MGKRTESTSICFHPPGHLLVGSGGSRARAFSPSITVNRALRVPGSVTRAREDMAAAREQLHRHPSPRESPARLVPCRNMSPPPPSSCCYYYYYYYYRRVPFEGGLA